MNTTTELVVVRLVAVTRAEAAATGGGGRELLPGGSETEGVEGGVEDAMGVVVMREMETVEAPDHDCKRIWHYPVIPNKFLAVILDKPCSLYGASKIIASNFCLKLSGNVIILY